MGVNRDVHPKAWSKSQQHPTMACHWAVKPLDRPCGQTGFRASSETLESYMLPSLFTQRFTICLKRNVPCGPQYFFPPVETRPDLRLHSGNVTVGWPNIKPSPHVRVSYKRSGTLTRTPTHRRCVSPARSIPRRSTRLETKTNKSFARSQHTDGKCGSMQVIIKKMTLGAKNQNLGVCV